MLDPHTRSVFDRIYATDLVFEPDCWKLCGDAHCCHFSRHKARFTMIAQSPFQELPLLPGEHEFLSEKGWLGQFGEFELKVLEYPLDHRRLTVESIVTHRAKCPCDHATRTAVCRLYPLLPVYDLSGRLVGTDTFGVYEELEKLDVLPAACALKSIPFDQLGLFLRIANLIGDSPVLTYYLTAYRLTKDHAFSRLAEQRKQSGQSAFRLFELGYLRNRLLDHGMLKKELIALADRYAQHYGDRFRL